MTVPCLGWRYIPDSLELSWAHTGYLRLSLVYSCYHWQSLSFSCNWPSITIFDFVANFSKSINQKSKESFFRFLKNKYFNWWIFPTYFLSLYVINKKILATHFTDWIHFKDIFSPSYSHCILNWQWPVSGTISHGKEYLGQIKTNFANFCQDQAPANS